MSKSKIQIDILWEPFRKAINEAYALAHKSRNEDGLCLRDYAEDVSWNDALIKLLQRETLNEKQHRSNRPSVPGFSAETAAKLILLNNACAGSQAKLIPSSTAFLVFRQTAVEAQVVGFLACPCITQDWRQAVSALDYAKLMQSPS